MDSINSSLKSMPVLPQEDQTDNLCNLDVSTFQQDTVEENAGTSLTVEDCAAQCMQEVFDIADCINHDDQCPIMRDIGDKKGIISIEFDIKDDKEIDSQLKQLFPDKVRGRYYTCFVKDGKSTYHNVRYVPDYNRIDVMVSTLNISKLHQSIDEITTTLGTDFLDSAILPVVTDTLVDRSTMVSSDVVPSFFKPTPRLYGYDYDVPQRVGGVSFCPSDIKLLLITQVRNMQIYNICAKRHYSRSSVDNDTYLKNIVDKSSNKLDIILNALCVHSHIAHNRSVAPYDIVNNVYEQLGRQGVKALLQEADSEYINICIRVAEGIHSSTQSYYTASVSYGILEKELYIPTIPLEKICSYIREDYDDHERHLVIPLGK